MTKLPQTSETYDQAFASGGAGGGYFLHYRVIPYNPLYKSVLRQLRKLGSRSVLEVGCGPGHFAHMLFDTSSIGYRGFDFSPIAIRQAQERTGRAEAFSIGDAYSAESYRGSHDTLVCTEVLEHLEGDREVIERWAPGTRCICSVPNYDSKYHVRFFRSEAEVKDRYGDLIDVGSIWRVRTPQVPLVGIRNRMAYAIRNLRRPRRVLRALGIHDFSRGGWFVFVGTRR